MRTILSPGSKSPGGPLQRLQRAFRRSGDFSPHGAADRRRQAGLLSKGPRSILPGRTGGWVRGWADGTVETTSAPLPQAAHEDRLADEDPVHL